MKIIKQDNHGRPKAVKVPENELVKSIRKNCAEIRKSTRSTHRGVQAILFLQGLAGITETEEQALQGWRSMNYNEKQTTLHFYELLKDTKLKAHSL